MPVINVADSSRLQWGIPLGLLVLALSVLLASLWPSLVGVHTAMTELVAVMQQYSHMDPLRKLGSQGALHVKKLLQADEFDLLGEWRHNASLIQDVNSQLISGLPVLLDAFLDSKFANKLYEELLSASGGGLLHSKHTSDMQFEATGINASAFHAAELPEERCKAMATVGHTFKFRHHACCKSSFALHDHPAMQSLLKSFEGNWTRAMNLLLAGSGYRLLDSLDSENRLAMALGLNSFREFTIGDYQLLHTDALSMRVVTLNYWLATPGWEAEWGGNLLWCGSPRYSGEREVLPAFPDAARIPPSFNQAVLFLPHVESIHAVEPVLAAKDAHAHRFAFSTWMRISGLDEARHWHAFSDRLRSTS